MSGLWSLRRGLAITVNFDIRAVVETFRRPPAAVRPICTLPPGVQDRSPIATGGKSNMESVDARVYLARVVVRVFLTWTLDFWNYAVKAAIGRRIFEPRITIFRLERITEVLPMKHLGRRVIRRIAQEELPETRLMMRCCREVKVEVPTVNGGAVP